MSLQEQRQKAVESTLADIQRIALSHSIDYQSLDEIAACLKALARQRDLFPVSEFPPPDPSDPEASTRYLLRKEPDNTFALYLNSINPGKKTVPHNHTTWAVIVAVDGDELNKVYKRVDDGSSDDHADLVLQREVVVSPGRDHVAFLADDIHSIHVVGNNSTRHFHLYGKALELLTERVGYDLEKKRVLNYNRNYHAPSNETKAG
jgi:predicted metal-dependent enzyme (double-stranded beta helix superfamily)